MQWRHQHRILSVLLLSQFIIASTRVEPVTISGKIDDNLSGIDPATARFSVHDEYGKVEPSGPVAIAVDGSYSFTVELRTFVQLSDADGRLYKIRVSAADYAGNMRANETSVTAKRLKEPPPRPCGKRCG